MALKVVMTCDMCEKEEMSDRYRVICWTDSYGEEVEEIEYAVPTGWIKMEQRKMVDGEDRLSPFTFCGDSCAIEACTPKEHSEDTTDCVVEGATVDA